MNLSKLFEMQKVLDERIEKEHPRQDGEDRLVKKILALQVELGELANEWRGFKFWSKNQTPNDEIYTTCRDEEAKYFLCGVCHDSFTPSEAKEKDYECRKDHNVLIGMKKKNPLLEEYVDCLHFILSIGLEIGFTDYEAIEDQTILECSTAELFLVVFGNITTISEIDETNKYYFAYSILFMTFNQLGQSLGFAWEEIEQAYISKNEVNHERQANNY